MRSFNFKSHYRNVNRTFITPHDVEKLAACTTVYWIDSIKSFSLVSGFFELRVKNICLGWGVESSLSSWEWRCYTNDPAILQCTKSSRWDIAGQKPLVCLYGGLFIPGYSEEIGQECRQVHVSILALFASYFLESYSRCLEGNTWYHRLPNLVINK